jgi:molybdate transport system substrate-binding protein
MRSRHPFTGPLLAAAALLASLALAGCSSDDGDAGGANEPDEVTLIVFAAASLTSTFEQLAEQFEAEHDGVTVSFNFAGSSDLVAQIQQGAPADVVATADTANIDKLSAEDLLAADPTHFASNTLEIAVPPGNPADITSLDDLTKPDLKLVLCAPEVPCGSAALKIAEAADVTLKPVSEEASVTDVLGKVTSGEADAGLVYVTDVLAAGGSVEGIAFPESAEAVNVYPIASVGASEQAELAQEFVDLVLGPDGSAILSNAGFARP